MSLVEAMVRDTSQAIEVAEHGRVNLVDSSTR